MKLLRAGLLLAGAYAACAASGSGDAVELLQAGFDSGAAIATDAQSTIPALHLQPGGMPAWQSRGKKIEENLNQAWEGWKQYFKFMIGKWKVVDFARGRDFEQWYEGIQKSGEEFCLAGKAEAEVSPAQKKLAEACQFQFLVNHPSRPAYKMPIVALAESQGTAIVPGSLDWAASFLDLKRGPLPEPLEPTPTDEDGEWKNAVMKRLDDIQKKIDQKGGKPSPETARQLEAVKKKLGAGTARPAPGQRKARKPEARLLAEMQQADGPWYDFMQQVPTARQWQHKFGAEPGSAAQRQEMMMPELATEDVQPNFWGGMPIPKPYDPMHSPLR